MGDMVGHTKRLKMKRLAIAPALAVAMISAGCGPGIQLEGPGFDALGLSGKKQVEKKVPDRAPLLIPPDPNRLPEPAPRVANARPQNWPTDPEDTVKAKASVAAKKKQDYEDSGDWSKNADIDEFEKLSDPIKRQEVGLLNKWYQGQHKIETVEDDDPTNLDPGK